MTSPTETNPNSIADAYTSIRTRYIGSTNFQGSRISVQEAKWSDILPRRLTMPYDHGYNLQENHAIAAQLWIDKYLHDGNKVKDYGLVFDGDYYWTWEGYR